MDADQVGHIPVLGEAVGRLLAPRPGEVVLDCTAGRGGHAAALIPRLGPGGVYVALDLDAGNLAYTAERCGPIAADAGVALHTVHQSFASARGVLNSVELNSADVLLADLGFASNQVDDPSRGLSFRHDGPLDMRLDPSGAITAEQLVNTLPERELADVIYRFGEERLSRRVARKIVESRAREPILTTLQLAVLCRQAYGPRARNSRIDPATRTFQALRIAVNGELDALDRLLGQVRGLLSVGGRAGLISFHSLEDRPVKQAFLQAQQEGWGQRLTRKPVTAEEDELARNSRSRSAKLRVLKRLEDAPPTASGVGPN